MIQESNRIKGGLNVPSHIIKEHVVIALVSTRTGKPYMAHIFNKKLTDRNDTGWEEQYTTSVNDATTPVWLQIR